MSLRLIEVTVREDGVEAAQAALEDTGAIDVWVGYDGPDRAMLRVLADADKTEGVTDALTDLFGSDARYRIVVLDVEATLPEPEPEEKEPKEVGPDKPPPVRISREELRQELMSASKMSGVYVVTVALSTIVAAIGLIRGDVAIIIGAMVIAPLLGPQVALSLASTLGDLDLARRALTSSAAGAGTAVLFSVALGLVLTVDPSTPAIAIRSQVGPGDVGLALAAGSAGALAFTSGLSSAVIGVMVAVALLPPTVAFGLLFGAGHAQAAVGAGVLVVTNVVCVNLAGVVTFLAQRVRPRTWWEQETAKKAWRWAVISWLAMLGILLWVMLTWL